MTEPSDEIKLFVSIKIIDTLNKLYQEIEKDIKEDWFYDLVMRISIDKLCKVLMNYGIDIDSILVLLNRYLDDFNKYGVNFTTNELDRRIKVKEDIILKSIHKLSSDKSSIINS